MLRPERNDVDERGRPSRDLPDEGERVSGLHLDAVVVTPQQPDGTAVEHVDGRNNCEFLKSTC